MTRVCPVYRKLLSGKSKIYSNLVMGILPMDNQLQVYGLRLVNFLVNNQIFQGKMEGRMLRAGLAQW
jgi:hypothetical protein